MESPVPSDVMAITPESCAAMQQELERYRSLIEDIQEVVFETDERGRWTFLSSAWEALSGYPVSESLGVCFLDYVHPEDYARNVAQFESVILRGVPKTLHEVRYVRRDGSLRWVQVHARLFKDGEGRVAGTRGTLVDITERVNAENALQDSQWFLESIIQHLPVQIFVKSVPELQMVLVNKAVEDVTGVCREEMLGKTDLELLPYDLAQYYETIDQRVLATGALIDIPEERNVLRDGSERINYTRKIPIRDAEGRTRYILGLSEDITERLAAEERIRESEARYHALSRLLQSYSYCIRLHPGAIRTIEWTTDTMSEILQYSSDDLRQVDWAEFIHPDDVSAYRSHRERLLGNEASVIEVRVRRRDGVYRWIRSSGFPEWSEREQRVVKIYGAGQDITAAKESEMELIRERDRAEEMNRLKDAFLSNMSHEIRTPLTSIIGFSEVLKEEFGGEGGEFLEMIHVGATRLLDTLNSVLDLAQLESRTLHIMPEQVDLVAEARSVVELFRLRPEHENISFKVNAPPGGIRLVQDRAALGRVLTNLVSNAVKFTPQGSVRLDLREEGDYAFIEVTDTGEGIAEEFLPHLFVEFRQESTGHARRHEGNGLGLAITRRLLDLMGGEITVRTQKGYGSSFIVKLPRGVPQASDPGSQSVRYDEPPGQTLVPKARLLVVEDSEENQMLLSYILSSEYDLELVGTYDAAIEAISCTAFDVILVDINLGSTRNGIDLLGAIRASTKNASTRAIACTAYALPEDKGRFLAEGFDHYLSKPFRTQVLLGVIEEALRTK